MGDAVVRFLRKQERLQALALQLGCLIDRQQADQLRLGSSDRLNQWSISWRRQSSKKNSVPALSIFKIQCHLNSAMSPAEALCQDGWSVGASEKQYGLANTYSKEKSSMALANLSSQTLIGLRKRITIHKQMET